MGRRPVARFSMLSPFFWLTVQYVIVDKTTGLLDVACVCYLYVELAKRAAPLVPARLSSPI